MMPVIFSTDFLAQRESRQRSEKEEKLRLAKSLSLLAFLFFLAGCDLVAQQYPLTGFNSNAVPGLGNAPSSQSSGIAQSVTQPITQPQVTGAQRTAHVWDKALQGMAMGGAIAGWSGRRFDNRPYRGAIHRRCLLHAAQRTDPIRTGQG